MSVEFQLDTRKLDQIMNQLDYNTDQVVGWLAKQVEAQTKVNIAQIPLIDTGALWNSITAKQQHLGVWDVYDGVEYGIFWELGHRTRAFTKSFGAQNWIPARPFMVPACEKIAHDLNSGRTWERLFK
jgi:ABC-type thiamine transport system substrate-binding protein